MTLPTNIIDYFPDQTPRGEILVTGEKHLFQVLNDQIDPPAVKSVYQLNKAPIDSIKTVRATVGGSEVTLSKGEDYEVRNYAGGSEPGAIAFTNPDRYPDDDTDFEVDYYTEPVIERYTEAHGDEVDDVSDEIEDVIDGRSVDTAQGTQLDLLGSRFDTIGLRRGRNDTEYRQYLASIVPSFRGRGTKSGIKFAIASGLNIDRDNVLLEEDTDEVGYTVTISELDTSVSTEIIDIMSDLADAGGVERLDPIYFQGSSAAVGRFVHPGSQITSDTMGLGGGQLSRLNL